MVTDSAATSFTATLKQYRNLLSVYLQPLKGEVAALAVMLFGGIGLQLWTPLILQEFIDLAQSSGMSDALVQRAVLFLVLAVLGRILQLGTSYVTQDVRWRATNALRGDLAEHCLKLDMGFHHAHTPGSIISRIDGDVNVLSNFFSQFVLQLVGNAGLLIGIIVVLTIEDWRIGTVFLTFVSAVGLVLGRSIALTAPLWKALLQVESEQYGFLEEHLGGTEDIRANGAGAYVLRQMKQLMRGLYLALRKALMTSMVLNYGFTEGMTSLGAILALGLGGYLLLRGELTIGTVYLVIHYNMMLKWPLNELVGQIRDLQSAVGSVERVQELFDTQPEVREPEPPSAQTLPSGPLALRFSSVDFGYEAEGLVLRDLTWALAPGDVLGILGRTGSGKTTITRLLCRLYDPREGEVRVGDVLLSRVPLADLHRRVGVVTQDVQLFEATVRDNLTVFDDAIDDDTLLSAVGRLGLGPWLQALPDGLDTMLSASTAGQSAGEAQLLAFTRVFLRDPGLVILDEASSRLDPLTERLMEHAIDRLFQDRTAVIVAHRLATVQRADKIMILEDGRIVEFGERLVLEADPASRFSQLLRTGLEEVLA